MDDDVERIDLVDDFHVNRPAKMKPIRANCGHECNYHMPPSLAKHVFSANVYQPSQREKNRKEEADDLIFLRGLSRVERISRVCQFVIRNGQMLDWYFSHNVVDEEWGEPSSPTALVNDYELMSPRRLASA